MATWCLIKSKAEKFRKMLTSGEINPDKLSSMSSAERREFFKSFGEEDAKQLNALFESKMILKNQERGYITWAKNAFKDEAVKNKMIEKIKKLDKVLVGDEEEKFLADLAEKKLGVGISEEETRNILNLAKKADELSKDLSTEANQIAYGNALLDTYDYLDEINPYRAGTAEKVANTLGVAKAAMATGDFSAAFRQGWGMVSTKEFWKDLPEMFKYGFSEKAYRDSIAKMIGDPFYAKFVEGSDLGITSIGGKLSKQEEHFASTILAKLPIVRGSERAYVGFLNKLRFDRFKTLVKMAEVSGENVSKGSKTLKDIAEVVNTFTGRGSIGKGDQYAHALGLLNSVFFSPRKIMATVNMLNPQTYITLSPVARKAALRQLIGSVGITASILTLAGMVGADIEWNPQSSDFGKIKIGKTRYEITGGNGTYAVLLARIFTNKTKSTTTGKIRELGEGYKADTRADMVSNFGRNKLAPMASLFVNWMVGENSIGEAFDVKKELKERFTPMVVGDMIELFQTDPQNMIPAFLATELGVGVQSY